MSNHCVECNTPLLASYCGKHEPSWFIRLYYKISFFYTKWKLKIIGYHEYEEGEENLYE